MKWVRLSLCSEMEILLVQMNSIPKLSREEVGGLLWYLHHLRDTWENLKVTANWKDTQLITIFKKGDRWNSSNYHEISFLSIPGKVFIYIQLNRLSTLVEDFLPEVVSVQPKEPWIWSSPCNKYSRNALNWTFSSTWYLLTSQKSLTLCYQACICPAQNNESISQLKRRTQKTIWGWEWSKMAVFLPSHCSWFFSLWSCLMPPLIPHKEYGYKVDWEKTYLMPVNLSLQESLEMFWYSSSCLLMILPSWHAITKLYRK